MFLNPRRTRAGVSRPGSAGFSQGRRRSAARGRVTYDAAAAAAFYDEYGEQEWTRFEDGRTSAISLTTHLHYLHRFVHAGDRVLDIGCGPEPGAVALGRHIIGVLRVA